VRRLPLLPALLLLLACPAGEPDPVETAAVAFEQAVDGAMFANPDLYPELPVVIRTTSDTTVGWVSVTVGDQVLDAAPIDLDRWLVTLAADDLADGVWPITAEATGGSEGGLLGSASAELVLGRDGIQVTSFDADGAAGTPRLHRYEGGLYLSWVARNGQPERQAWLQRIDGAGRPLGEALMLSDPGEETLYARPAIGDGIVFVLGQDHGSPYTTWFRAVELGGAVRQERFVVDRGDYAGAFGGDVAWDGDIFHAAWRDQDGAGDSRVLHGYYDPGGIALTLPTQIAQSGTGNPSGSFPPFSFVKLEAEDGQAVISFTRSEWHDTLAMEIQRASWAILDADEWDLDAGRLGGDGAMTFHWDWEGHVHRVGDRLVALWTSDDLSDDTIPIPTRIVGSFVDPLDGPNSFGATVLQAPDTRGEPFITGHPEHLGVMVWTDDRAYTEEPGNGHIGLYAAPVDEDLVAGEPIDIEHAVLVAGLTQPNAVTAGPNAIVTWIDERHGAGIMDPKPEVWLETVWLAPQ